MKSIVHFYRQSFSSVNQRVLQLTFALMLLCTGFGIQTSASQSLSPMRFNAGDLAAAFICSGDGFRLEKLWDNQTQMVLATNAVPLFSLELGDPDTKIKTNVNSSSGWREVSVRSSRTGFKVKWQRGLMPHSAELTVNATATFDTAANALRWTLTVKNESRHWTVRRVTFPQIGLADFGQSGVVLVPRGPGELQRNLWRKDARFRGNYPDGWCSMQFMAAYREDNTRAGLFYAMLDPWGSTKHLEMKSSAAAKTVSLGFEMPAPEMNEAGNDFTLSGQAVWQLLRGDWFDAATIYREWARKEARWWPALTKNERADTPQWMRELNAWVMTGGAPGECISAVKGFRESFGLPVGFHWYNWHQIPFDNDYPHYFPTKPGFAQGVAELESAGVHVMPYINGRLWDSKDRLAEDYQFTSIAMPAVTKQEDGKPFMESYGSKETNGQPVRLGVMCPTTRLWQDKVRDIVIRLQRDEGVSGVYIDQIAAAAPTLCMDKSHGHPLGGGHWWTQGYWDMLKAIRKEMPPGRMLTTECNGEPFIRWFDGYLTWHWQYDGQVPAFPAVYGGAVQMFGRAYRGGSTKSLALRMKAGQQLVYGEQIGWFDPGLALEPGHKEFLQKVIQTRAQFSRYFYAGEMARPPRLTGELPKVKADWQWSGEWWVTTDAVMTGAWRIPAEKRLLLLFANVSDQPVKASFQLLPKTYGFDRNKVTRRISVNGDAPSVYSIIRMPDEESLEFPAHSVQAWEIRSAIY